MLIQQLPSSYPVWRPDFVEGSGCRKTALTERSSYPVWRPDFVEGHFDLTERRELCCSYPVWRPDFVEGIASSTSALYTPVQLSGLATGLR